MLQYQHQVIQEDMATMVAQLGSAESFRGKTVLITGATGMLATYCLYFFLYCNDAYDANITVIALARNREKTEMRFADVLNRLDLRFLYQDIAEPIIYDEPVHHIFHMAGSASAYAIVNDPIGIISANVQGSINVMALAKRNSGCRVVFASTREVYGRLPSTITEITEDLAGELNQLDARSCYPESKRLAENICVNMGLNGGTEYVVARIAHAYGPGMALRNDGRVMADLLCNAVDGTDIVLKSDGSAMRAFCYVSDAVGALLRLAKDGVSGAAYNIANETEEISIRDLAFLIRDLCPNGSIQVTHREPTAEERAGYLKTARVKLSTKKMEALGWGVCVGTVSGVKRTLAVLKETH